MFRRCGIPIAMSVLIGFSVARAEPTVAARAPYAEAAQVLEPWIEREATAKGIPALSIALVDDQHVVWARGFGEADPVRHVAATADTVYRVGSVSKLFTDLAVLQLVNEGRVDLDAPVTRYLPEFAPGNPYGTPITLRHLLSHRSGLVREPPVGHYFDPTEPTLDETVRSLNQTELVYAPGTRTKYSNAGIAVVGAVVQRVRGEPFATTIERTLLNPLELRSSQFAPNAALTDRLARGVMWSYDGQSIATPRFALGTAPAGNLVSTVNDLGRFLSAVLDGGRGVVKLETFQRMLEPQFAKPGERPGFGLGFALSELDGTRRIGHSGAVYGFATEVAALPEEKLGVAVIAAKDCANGLTRHIADTALRTMRAVRQGKPLPKLESTAPIAAEVATRVAGRYVKDRDGGEVIARDGRLLIQPHKGGPRVEVRALSSSLIVDDCLAFGPPVAFPADGLVIAEKSYHRVPEAKPAQPPASWSGLIGEYGWDYDVLYILESQGKLHALIEWFFLYPLEEVKADTYRFPDSGLYESEKVVFTRDAAGRATQVDAAGVVFKRRAAGGEGEGTFRVKPLRPVGELRTESLAASPPREDGDFRAPDLVDLTMLDSTIRLDVRYATGDNFLGVPVYPTARALLQRPAAEALVRAHRNLNAQGYGLLIHDAYRPWYVTRIFWEATPVPGRAFVADPSKGSKHNRGAAVDLTLYDRASGRPIEMAGTYDEFSPRSNPDYPGGTSLQRWHRDLLRRAMEAEGFRVNEVEWWHFDHRDWAKYPILNVPFDAIDSRPK